MKNIGLDLGFGNVKVYGDKGATVFASHLALPRTSYAVDDEKKDETTTVVEFDGIRYAVGEAAFAKGDEVSGLNTRRLLGGTEVQAITYAGIGTHFANYGRPKDGLNVYVGLPASLLLQDEKADNVKAVEEWMLGKHEWIQDGKPVWCVIDSVTVRSQSAGAMYDMVHTLEGGNSKDARYAAGNVGVISIGFNTVELSGMLLGKAANVMMSSDSFGVHRLLESCKPDDRVSTMMTDYKYRHGLLNGNSANLSRSWADNVLSFVNSKWKKNAYNLDRVIAVGGGVKSAEDALRNAFGDRLWIPDNHISAISRGLYKRAVVDAKKA
jgi:Actin like proteins N terminal domain